MDPWCCISSSLNLWKIDKIRFNPHLHSATSINSVWATHVGHHLHIFEFLKPNILIKQSTIYHRKIIVFFITWKKNTFKIHKYFMKNVLEEESCRKSSKEIERYFFWNWKIFFWPMSREGINHGIKNRAAELALAHSSDGRLISQSPYCDDDDIWLIAWLKC